MYSITSDDSATIDPVAIGVDSCTDEGGGEGTCLVGSIKGIGMRGVASEGANVRSTASIFSEKIWESVEDKVSKIGSRILATAFSTAASMALEMSSVETSRECLTLAEKLVPTGFDMANASAREHWHLSMIEMMSTSRIRTGQSGESAMCVLEHRQQDGSFWVQSEAE